MEDRWCWILLIFQKLALLLGVLFILPERGCNVYKGKTHTRLRRRHKGIWLLRRRSFVLAYSLICDRVKWFWWKPSLQEEIFSDKTIQAKPVTDGGHPNEPVTLQNFNRHAKGISLRMKSTRFKSGHLFYCHIRIHSKLPVRLEVPIYNGCRKIFI